MGIYVRMSVPYLDVMPGEDFARRATGERRNRDGQQQETALEPGHHPTVGATRGPVWDLGDLPTL